MEAPDPLLIPDLTGEFRLRRYHGALSSLHGGVRVIFVEGAPRGLAQLPELRRSRRVDSRRLPRAGRQQPDGRDPDGHLRPAVRADRPGEPPPQARPRSVRHPTGRPGPPGPGGTGLRRSAVRRRLPRRPRARLGPRSGCRRGCRQGTPAAAAPDRRTGPRRAAVGAALRPTPQRLHRPVGADAARPLPRHPHADPAAPRLRRAADPRGGLRPDGPSRAGRRRGVRPGPGGARGPGRGGPGRRRPAAQGDGQPAG